MKFRILVLTFCIYLLSITHSFANDQLPLDKQTPISFSYQQNTSPRSISFPTRLGFLIVRLEDIITIKVDKVVGGLQVHYRKNNLDKIKIIQMSLSSVFDRLTPYSFLKISRCAIINLQEIEEYQGTRRDAEVLMTNGDKLKVSRSVAGDLYDYLKNLNN